MKSINIITKLCLLLLLFSGCKKDEKAYQSSASIWVVNATTGGAGVKVNAGAESSFTWAKATALSVYTGALYGTFRGSNNITLTKATDSTSVLFTRSIDLQPLSTLYLAGTAANTDTVFRVENNVPYIKAASVSPDNSVYIRFVNMSQGSNPLNIRITGAPTDEFTGLAYKSSSGFKKYVALSTTGNYVFEIRDAVSNVVLGSYTFITSQNRFKTVSLVIKGIRGVTTGADAFGVFLISFT